MATQTRRAGNGRKKEPGRQKGPGPPGFAFAAADQHGPSGGYGTWRLRTHRLKQHPRWHVDQLADGTFRWTTPSGRQYTAEPTRYPI